MVSRFVCHGLTTGEKYVFKVKAVNAAGYSNSSPLSDDVEVIPAVGEFPTHLFIHLFILQFLHFFFFFFSLEQTLCFHYVNLIRCNSLKTTMIHFLVYMHLRANSLTVKNV